MIKLFNAVKQLQNLNKIICSENKNVIVKTTQWREKWNWWKVWFPQKINLYAWMY